MKSAITALGIANPKFKQSQQAAAELVCSILNLNPAEKRMLKSLYKSTGIHYRHSVLSDYCKTLGNFEFFPNAYEDAFPSTSARMRVYKENALTLALAAIENCFITPDCIAKESLTHIITVSCTGMYAPGIDIEIIHHLKLNSNLKRTAINFMGCYGAFNAIKVANDICKADSNAKVLIVCIELCTIHFQKNTDLTSMISNAIFADGAAAIIIETQPVNKRCFTLESFYCDLLPQSSQEMAWHIADSGFDIILSTYVPQAIESGIAAFLEKLLQQAENTFSHIHYYAIHPGGLKILQACEKALNITTEDNQYSYDILKNYGNMSSPTVLFVLNKIWNDITYDDHNKNIFSCAFGPGLTLESMTLKTFFPN